MGKVSKLNKAGIVLLSLAMLLAPFLATFADTITDTTGTTADNSASLQQAQDEKAQLEKQLQDIENQIAQYQQELSGIRGEKNTLQNKIKQLQTQQAAVNLQIRSTNLQIVQLGKELVKTKSAINASLDKTERLKEQIAQLVREINDNDRDTFLYTLLAQNNWSDAMDAMESYLQLSDTLKNTLEQTAQTKVQLDQQKVVLAQQQEDAKDLLSIKVLAQQQLAGSMGEQSNLLAETKGRESSYQAALNDSQKRAAEIRNRLYQLLGVPTQITFGQAVEMATWAGAQTGVRPAFLLAILTQESNLGKNVGQCYLSDDESGSGVRITTGAAVDNVMKPNRDVQPFLSITAELGKDPHGTQVSCPMSYGWGGAMGPSQFIPSTWIGYREKVSAITGKPADPWNIKDAFLATALKSAKDGATSQSGEWAAAMRYFSGSTNKKYRFYGDNVVAMANQYQSDIDSMNGQ